MDSFRYKFEKIQKLNPFWSSWVCFCETLKELKINRRERINRLFNQFVDIDDYDKREKRELVDYLATSEF